MDMSSAILEDAFMSAQDYDYYIDQYFESLSDHDHMDEGIDSDDLMDHDEEHMPTTIDDMSPEDLFHGDLDFVLISSVQTVVGIDVEQYISEKELDAEDNLWLDRDDNGLIDFAEWLIFNTERKAW